MFKFLSKRIPAFKFLGKRIPTPIWVSIIVCFAIFIGVSIGWQYSIAIISFMIIILMITFAGYKKMIGHKLKCSKCGHIFEPSWLTSRQVIYGGFTLYFEALFKIPSFTRCPKCGKFSWCSLVKIDF